MFCLSATAMAAVEDDKCIQEKNIISTSEHGTYKFKATEQCSRMLKIVKNCQSLNAVNSKVPGAQKRDCSSMLKKKILVQVKRGNAVKISKD